MCTAATKSVIPLKLNGRTSICKDLHIMDVLHHAYAVTSAHNKVKLDEKVNK